MVPLLPRVTIFSATERAALALARVVVTRLCLMRLETKLASIALRCSPVRPSLAVRFKCLIGNDLWSCGDEAGERLPAHWSNLFGLGFFLGPFQQAGLEGHAER